MNVIFRWILSALLIMFIAWIVPGISVSNFLTALVVVVVIALINTFIKPLVTFIAMPVNFLTLGLFSLVINALLFLLAGKIISGIEIDGFWSALLGSLILSVFSPMISNLDKNKIIK
ncbi:phage holin family protein [bacterium]|nr:phage holin family protein [bacterium]